MEDYADIATGVYKDLTNIKGLMRERGEMSREALDKLKFYPLDLNLSPIVKLFLMSKEVSFLLYRLQQSLDVKMEQEGTRPTQDKTRERLMQEQQAQKKLDELLKKQGLKK